MAQDSIKRRFKTRLSTVLNQPRINQLRGVPMPSVTAENAQTAIARMIVEGGRLVGRVGATEGRATAFYLRHRLAQTGAKPAYEARSLYEMKAHSGYFPINDDSIDQFAILYLQNISTIDLYAAWTPFDGVLLPAGVPRCRLRDLDPFFTRKRWTMALRDRRVVVVSPFAATMRAQWTKRPSLFAVETLPDCDMHFVNAFQTHGESDVGDQNWLANLATMDAAVAEAKPDVVILGAGAYGLPLGALAKRRGATAIVMGGSTQLLFGIMGNRWMLFPEYRALMNPYWTRPGLDERPDGYQKLETVGGAYW